MRPLLVRHPWPVLLTVVLLVLGFGAAALSWRHDPVASGGRSVEVLQPLTGRVGPPALPSWTPWPQALHDAQHTGAATVRGPQTGRVRWSRDLEGNVTPGPVIAADGTIVVASNAGVLHGIDPGTGRDRWRFDGGGGYGADLSTSAAILPDGSILWPGPGHVLFGLSGTGVESWRLESRTGGDFTSPAVTPGGAVVIGDTAGGLTALHPSAAGPGVDWRVDLDDTSYGSAVWSNDGRTAYQSTFSGVTAVRDGRVVWHSSAPSEIVEVSPAVGPDETVVIGTNDPFEYGLDPADGSVRWRHRRDAWTYSSPGVTRDGIAYFGDHRNRITGVDVADGSTRFSIQGSTQDVHPGGIGVWTSVLVDAEHSVYAGTREGLVYGVDRAGGLLFQLDTGATVDSYPALTADGALIVGVSDGRLLAIADD